MLLTSGASTSSDASSPSLRLGLGLGVLLGLLLRRLLGILLQSLVGIGRYGFRLLAFIDCGSPSLGGFRSLFRIFLDILDFIIDPSYPTVQTV